MGERFKHCTHLHYFCRLSLAEGCQALCLGGSYGQAMHH